MLKEWRIFIVISVDRVIFISQKYKLVFGSYLCLNSAHSYIVKEAINSLQFNLLKLLQVGQDIGPDAVRVADYSTVGFGGDHQFLKN